MAASAVLDTYFTLRFIKLLTTPFNKTEAFKLGIIDDEGNALKDRAELETAVEKAAYTKFHILVFNLKKLLHKFPLGLKTIGKYALALTLLREHIGTALIEKNALTVRFVDYVMENQMIDETLCESTDTDLVKLLDKYVIEDTGVGAMGTGSFTTGMDIVDAPLAPTEKIKKKKKFPQLGVQPFKQWTRSQLEEKE